MNNKFGGSGGANTNTNSSGCGMNNKFCLRMANHVLLEEGVDKESNIVVCPLSIHLTVSLMAAGSSGRPILPHLLSILNSPTLDHLNSISSQILSLAFNGKEEEDGRPLLCFVNGAWVSRFTMDPVFQEIAKMVYKAEVKEVDFEKEGDQVREEINSWAENATKGLIKNLVSSDSLSSHTAQVFANALYLKAAWSRKFNASKTMHKNFHLINGQVVQVPFITCEDNKYHYYGSYDDYAVLRLFYKASRLAMYFFLPHKKDGLPHLIRKFNSNPAGFFTQQFMLQEVDISDFWIPRFEFSAQFDASKAMNRLLSSPNNKKGMPSSLNQSNMFQKVYIKVDEEGTEAAAATYEEEYWDDEEDFRPCVQSFVADHPFLFMIREEKSQIVFFTGALLNPGIHRNSPYVT